KWQDDSWKKLTTLQVGADENFYYFEAHLDSLSIFAITAEKSEGVVGSLPACQKTCSEGEELNIESCKCSPIIIPGISFDTIIFAIIIITIIVSLLAITIYAYKGKSAE
ncbi:PGF-pre-PGF domain-containing protein, partial [Candidatus Woesearchaeota archaeon]|nr:PGF-pre-PGF domain-containing protein [Candidatus Woesearchaeota archaeon]